MKCLKYTYGIIFSLKYFLPAPTILLTGDLPNSSHSKFRSLLHRTLSGEKQYIRLIAITFNSSFQCKQKLSMSVQEPVSSSCLLRHLGLDPSQVLGWKFPCLFPLCRCVSSGREDGISWRCILLGPPQNVRKLGTGSCWRACFVY